MLFWGASAARAGLMGGREACFADEPPLRGADGRKGGGRIISSRGAFHFGFIEGRAVFLAIDIGRNIRLQS